MVQLQLAMAKAGSTAGLLGDAVNSQGILYKT